MLYSYRFINSLLLSFLSYNSPDIKINYKNNSDFSSENLSYYKLAYDH